MRLGVASRFRISGPVFLTYLVQSVSCDLAVQRPYHGRVPSPVVEGEKLLCKNVYLHNSVCVYVGLEVGKNTNSACISGCVGTTFIILCSSAC